ncbi:MAG: hypothetical protein MUQ32_17325, partial [Chloroflexi bacterium]|nr:hypothetical protein [Chloroflexota bacterium]
MAAVSDEMDRAGTLAPLPVVGAPLDRLFGVAVAIGLVVTVLVLVPGVHGHAILPAADLVLDTIAAVVFIVLTALAWARYRERRVIAAAYHAGAFMALSVAYGLAVLISLQHAAYLDGQAEPDNVQVLAFAVARILAAILFVIAGVATRRRTY